ncbi:MAG: glycosyltransferase [bacterium]
MLPRLKRRMYAGMVPSLSVVIPTRNERANIRPLLAVMQTALAGIDYEIVFVDDSTDGTEQVLAAVAAANPGVSMVHRPQGRGSRGLASAVVAGFARSRGEVIGVCDADLQHPPGTLAILARRLAETDADIVIASRYLPGGGSPGLAPWRKVVSYLTRLLAWALLRAARRSSDPLSGLFVVRRPVIEGVTFRPVGFKILLEILVRGRYRRIAEVPYVFDERAAGRTKATLRQGLVLLHHLMMLAASSPADARLWKFLMVGASGLLVNNAAFWTLTQRLSVHYFYAGVVAGLLATGSNFLLNNAFTWADRRDQAVSGFLQRMGRYYAATWAGMLVYLALLRVLVHVGLVPMLANLIAVGIGGMLNYLMHNLWTWRQQGVGG